MIVQVRQTKANIKQNFEVYYNGALLFFGKLSAASSVLPSRLYKLDGGIRLQSKRKIGSIFSDQIVNCLFGAGVIFLFTMLDNDFFMVLGAILLFILINLIPRTERVCGIFDGSGNPVASFSRIKKTFIGTYYQAKCEDKEYLFYTHSHSHYKHISIYLNDEQVAQIEKDLHTEDNKDAYTLYLLDSDEAAADLFTMFILYYDNYNHTNRGSVSIGMSWNRAWTAGPTNRFYNKEWLTANFGKKAD